MARILGACCAAMLAASPAIAASKPAKPKPGQLTTTDLRTCMGLNNSTPAEQVPACTKILKSGSVKHPYEADYYATRGAAYLALDKLDEFWRISQRRFPFGKRLSSIFSAR